MEILMIIILVMIIIVCVIAVFYATIYNRFQDYIIRINEVESIIDNNLRNKYDLINRIIPIIKGTVDNDKDIFEEIIKIRSRKISNFELYRILMQSSIQLNSLKEFPDINKSDEIKKVTKQIEDIDNKIENYIDYYNENITIYNTLVKKFPSNIIAIFSKYKENSFWS